MKVINLQSLISFNLHADHKDIIKMSFDSDGKEVRDLIDAYFDNCEIQLSIAAPEIIKGIYQGSIVEFNHVLIPSEKPGQKSKKQVLISFLTRSINKIICPVLKGFDPSDILGSIDVIDGRLIAKLNGSIHIDYLMGLGFSVGFNPKVKPDGHFSEIEIFCLSLGSQ